MQCSSQQINSLHYERAGTCLSQLTSPSAKDTATTALELLGRSGSMIQWTGNELKHRQEEWTTQSTTPHWSTPEGWSKMPQTRDQKCICQVSTSSDVTNETTQFNTIKYLGSTKQTVLDLKLV